MSKKYQGLEAYDGFEFSSRSITAEGFLEAPATIARTGVQLYRARELGLEKYGVPGDQVVRLNRAPEALFNPATLDSFQSKPVINGVHTTVNADNWKDLAVGDYTEAYPNGTTLDVKKLTVRDKGSVDDVLGGKKFLSIGYKFDIDMTPGRTADGQEYDGSQCNIIGNHVLICDNPRGGPVCRIGDTDTTKEKKMRKLIINGVPVEVGDSEAGIIESLQNQLTEARNQQPSVTLTLGAASKTVTGGDAIISEFNALNAKITELQGQIVGDAQIEERVQARLVVIGDAVKLVKDFDAKGKNTNQIHQEVLTKVTAGDAQTKSVVDAILAGKTIGDAAEDALATAFRAIAAKGVVAEANGADTAFSAAVVPGAQAGDSNGAKPRVLSGAAGFHERSRDAWKGDKK